MRVSTATLSAQAVRGGWARLLESLAGAPAYRAGPADLRTVSIIGLELPVRATIAVSIVVFAVLFDHNRTFFPSDVAALGRQPAAMLVQSIERLVLFGIVPLLAVVLIFRDRPADYGLRLGDWRWGMGLALAGCALMTPITVALARLPEFRDYYTPSATALSDLVTTNALDLLPAEFAFRGFLMFTLLRAIGPLGILVATLPFVFAHLGKPQVETLSTLVGGMVYGWLDWRTGSILWSGLAHVYIVTLVIVAAAAA